MAYFHIFNLFRIRYTNGSRTPSAYDSDSLRSRESEQRPKVDMQFGLKRFIDDLGGY